MLGEEEYHDVFSEAYASVMQHVRGEEGFWVSQHEQDILQIPVLTRGAYSSEERPWKGASE